MDTPVKRDENKGRALDWLRLVRRAILFSNSDDTLKAQSLDEVEVLTLISFWLRD